MEEPEECLIPMEEKPLSEPCPLKPGVGWSEMKYPMTTPQVVRRLKEHLREGSTNCPVEEETERERER